MIDRIVVACDRPWVLESDFDAEFTEKFSLSYFDNSKSLADQAKNSHGRTRIFFPFWSSRIPQSLLDNFDCIIFHMTDLPFGRGGSPLQNLIQGGHSDTVICAVRATSEIDAGPILARRPLSLHGTAGEIYARAAVQIVRMIQEIADGDPLAEEQVGRPTFFNRRKPSDSRIPETLGVDNLYDFIRMLDAPGYPRAFIPWGELMMTFSEAVEVDGAIEARVLISPLVSGDQDSASDNP